MKTRILAITTFTLLLILALAIFLPLDLGITNFYTLREKISAQSGMITRQQDEINALKVYRDDLLKRFTELSERLEDM